MLREEGGLGEREEEKGWLYKRGVGVRDIVKLNVIEEVGEAYKVEEGDWKR